MDVFYRVLGVAASLSHSVGRQRVNGVPNSIGPLAGWLILPVFLLGGLMDMEVAHREAARSLSETAPRRPEPLAADAVPPVGSVGARPSATGPMSRLLSFATVKARRPTCSRV
ncbi:MAG: hypothetical protein ACO1SX_27925 [Actinomycetota bacterium]